jgi:histidine ammonia-lyase
LAYLYDPEKFTWELRSGKQAMKKAGITRIALEAKEGLALNNGTQVSTALLALACYDARQLVKTADIAMAMSLEALEGMSPAFRPEVHELRPHRGQLETAENIRRLTQNSLLLDRHYERVQDAYSLRCHPQVLAGVRDTLRFIENTLMVEMNSTNDNPIIFPDSPAENKAVSAGNFHAQPIAFAADFLSIVLCEVGSIAERRIFRMSDKNLNCGLPSFLVSNSGTPPPPWYRKINPWRFLPVWTPFPLAKTRKTMSAWPPLPPAKRAKSWKTCKKLSPSNCFTPPRHSI